MRTTSQSQDPEPCSESCGSPEAEQRIRADIVHFCKLLHEKNYLAANDGNVSYRLCPHRVLITPSGVPKAFMTPGDLVVVSPQGAQLSGSGKPSGELAMHLAALHTRPDVVAVVHAHPPTCIAVTLIRHLRLNDVLPEVILSVGRLEVVPYARPLTDALANAVAERLEKADAVILERHGTVTLGKTVAEAYARTERLEHAAYVLWLAHAIGSPVPLAEQEARRLEDIYATARAQTDRMAG
jgi:L-fuculose-phosphate aldolase